MPDAKVSQRQELTIDLNNATPPAKPPLPLNLRHIPKRRQRLRLLPLEEIGMPKSKPQTLLSLWQNRHSTAARHELISHLTPIVFRTLRRRRMPPGVSIEDVANDSVLYILSHLDEYDPSRSGIGVYVRRQTIYQYQNEWRRSNKGEHAELDGDIPEPSGHSPCPVEQEEIEESLRSALSDQEFKIVWSTIINAEPLEVVARMLGLSDVKARRIRKAAIAKLRTSEIMKYIHN